MYTVPEYKIEIRLISTNGEVEVYPDYKTFITNITYWFVEHCVVTTFKDYSIKCFIFWTRNEKPKKYIVRDEFGSVFTPTEILNSIRNNNIDKHIRSEWYYREHNFIYRETPVPFTGKRKYSFGSWYKTPRHIQEKKWNTAHKEYVRGKRRPRNLPNPWNDNARGDIDTRKNWKSRRKTQWK
jgi:hypothetical protein